MKKTGKELLKELPKGVRYKAIHNMQKYHLKYYEKFIEKQFNSLADFLTTAFNWHDSVEGTDYWLKLCDKLTKQPTTT